MTVADTFMHRETRHVRPFVVPTILEDLFEATVLRFGEETVEAGHILHWDYPDAYASQPVILAWSKDGEFEDFRTALRQGAEEMGIPQNELALVVTATTRYLGVLDIVAMLPVADLRGTHDTVDLRRLKPNAAGLLSGVRGGRVDVYLLLSRQREQRVLEPWRKGTWLSHTWFTIATDREESLFRPLPLNGEMRTELGLSEGVLRHVVMAGDVWEPYDPDNSPVLYFDANTLNDVAARPRDPVSRLVQAELVCVFLRGVLAQAYADREEWRNMDWGELRDSLLGRVIQAVVGRSRAAAEYEAHLAQLEREGPERLASECESAVGLLEPIQRAFGNNP